MNSQIVRNAYHESGHAVVCHYLKRNFELVTIASHESCFLKPSQALSRQYLYEQLNDNKVLDVEKNMVLKESALRLAGIVSESVFMNEDGWISDPDSCAAVLLDFFNDELTGLRKEIIQGGLDDIENILTFIEGTEFQQELREYGETGYSVCLIKFLAIMLIETRKLLSTLWAAVEALSRELQKKYTVYEKDVIKIIEDAFHDANNRSGE